MSVQTPFTSLTLARLLQEWVRVEGDPSRLDVAQRLGEWLSPVDSVKLDGALQAISSYGAQARQPGQAVDALALQSACTRVKKELADLIAVKTGPLQLVRGAKDRAGDGEADAAAEADYGTHLQRYAALQKQMDAKISACRADVRRALSQGSPRLRQLSALDGVMAEMLGERAHKLLGAVPVYLERRFTHWRQVHQHQMVAAGIADDESDPGLWPLPGGWLHGFQQDMRQMLLAELQARLQPVLGLIEAAQEENRL